MGAGTSVDSIEIRRVTSLCQLQNPIPSGGRRCMNAPDAISRRGATAQAHAHTPTPGPCTHIRPRAPTSSRQSFSKTDRRRRTVRRCGQWIVACSMLAGCGTNPSKNLPSSSHTTTTTTPSTGQKKNKEKEHLQHATTCSSNRPRPSTRNPKLLSSVPSNNTPDAHPSPADTKDDCALYSLALPRGSLFTDRWELKRTRGMRHAHGLGPP
ncbi:hypothetical protein QBC39DRAFT_15900 [Podospora conica]|nr:hypothetical protein QBC39DRAFT_15900 [Schizothecium conicum]